jgi:hypothetical protein
VIFTLNVVNDGKTSATALLFSNVLPQEFGAGQSGFKDFNFDPQTRLLTWNGDQAGVTTLAPGQALTLEYSLRIDAPLDEVQIVDSATFSSDGLSESLLAEAALTVLSPKKKMTTLDPKVAGQWAERPHTSKPAPERSHAPRGLLIQDLNDSLPVNTDQPWLKFASRCAPETREAAPAGKGSNHSSRAGRSEVRSACRGRSLI